MSEGLDNRRPLKTRSAGWAGATARMLGRAGVRPNAISAASVVFALTGAGLLVLSGRTDDVAARAALVVGAALCIQLRLLANMLDGMVAVEQGLGSPTGAIWNELPDRIADALFLAGAGYGAALAGQADGVWLGWLASVLAVLTAYVRELGRGLGFPADFSGPMAKPHRMFTLTVACLVAAAEPLWGWRGEASLIALGVIAAGSLATVWRRTGRLAKLLNERSE